MLIETLLVRLYKNIWGKSWKKGPIYRSHLRLNATDIVIFREEQMSLSNVYMCVAKFEMLLGLVVLQQQLSNVTSKKSRFA